MPSLSRLLPADQLILRQRVCAPLPASAVLVCHPPLSQIRMEYWHPTTGAPLASVFVEGDVVARGRVPAGRTSPTWGR